MSTSRAARSPVNGTKLGPGDAAKIENEPEVRLSGGDGAEVLVFELP
jgi:hypothetical protein